MPIAINGSGTITGVSVGGLPDGIVDTDMIAADAVTDAKENLSGAAKVWVNFNGSTMGIFDSYNVSSLTDNGTGDYTINFSITMPNNDYVLVTNQRLDTSGGAPNIVHTGNEHDDNTTTSAKIVCGTGNQNGNGASGSVEDVTSIAVAIFGA